MKNKAFVEERLGWTGGLATTIVVQETHHPSFFETSCDLTPDEPSHESFPSLVRFGTALPFSIRPWWLLSPVVTHGQ
jgi:hypothetical protein